MCQIICTTSLKLVNLQLGGKGTHSPKNFSPEGGGVK